MELWFSDYHTDKVKMSVKVEKQLFGEQTDFQRIDVFDSKEFGRFISSDGSIVFSEKDEFVYDEMIVHVPMAVHPNVHPCADSWCNTTFLYCAPSSVPHLNLSADDIFLT